MKEWTAFNLEAWAEESIVDTTEGEDKVPHYEFGSLQNVCVCRLFHFKLGGS